MLDIVQVKWVIFTPDMKKIFTRKGFVDINKAVNYDIRTFDHKQHGVVALERFFKGVEVTTIFKKYIINFSEVKKDEPLESIEQS